MSHPLGKSSRIFRYSITCINSSHNLGFFFSSLINRAITTSSSNSTSKLELTKETGVYHSNALTRHKKFKEKCISYSDAPLFMTPQTRFWKRPHMLTSVTTNGARPSIITLLSVPAIHHTNKYVAYFIFVLRFLNQRGVQCNGILLATLR